MTQSESLCFLEQKQALERKLAMGSLNCEAQDARNKNKENNGIDQVIIEERLQSFGLAEYDAIASLSGHQSSGLISFDDVMKADQILLCWREAGKLVATMPRRKGESSSAGSCTTDSGVSMLYSQSITHSSLETPMRKKNVLMKRKSSQKKSARTSTLSDVTSPSQMSAML